MKKGKNGTEHNPTPSVIATSWEMFHNSALNRVETVVGFSEDILTLTASQRVDCNKGAAAVGHVGICIDCTNTSSTGAPIDLFYCNVNEATQGRTVLSTNAWDLEFLIKVAGFLGRG